jgi:phasin family protein
MANPRQAEKPADKEVRQAAHEAAQRLVEETSRAAQSAADAGAGAARAGAEMVHRNTETMQHAWQSSSRMASQLAERSFERFTHAFGIGGESAQQAAQQSCRNLESIVQSGTIPAGGLQSISREWLEFARRSLEQNLQQVDALAACRSPQEMLAAHSDLLRDNLEGFVQSTRRIAEISLQTADEAARRMSDASLAPR